MLVAERLLVAFAYFIHHGLELLLIPLEVLRLLDFVRRHRQLQRVNPALHKIFELSLVCGLRWRAQLTNGLLRQLQRQRRVIEVKTQLFARLFILWALDSLNFLHFECSKTLRKPFAAFRFAIRRIL